MTIRQRIREFLHSFTPYRRAGVIIGLFAVGCLLIWGFYEASQTLRSRWQQHGDAKLIQQVESANKQAEAADQRAKELQLKLIDKGNQLAAAEKRAETAETALQDARTSTARIRAKYEEIRNRPTTDTTTVDGLCAKLIALGFECRPM